ncbi:RpiR family transcriptional regulator [Gracilibacillus halophilus YIM-C55.5]|uniref:RpiR family transcriptional regulator n=1 Tax=Gracilibacillus halophilus YIM-C55.5 TaxID=1308866 RepID=N4WC75_9BACI|nr:MurR/RpiR family transcriptional regulator [Gracilibacillus halophilus]ENH96854.1 RpiR family transcriptional regulator [Gracilibacillus halophilus YIM-C55.5]
MFRLSLDQMNLTESQTIIANYLSKHWQEVLVSTEKDIAEATGISIATVSRFWSVAGYKNLKDFKNHMKHELEVSPARKIQSVQPKKNQLTPYITIEKSLSLLQDTIDNTDHASFQQAIELLHRSNRIYVLANGPSKGLGELFVYRVKRLGKPIHFINNQGNELFEDMIHMNQDDALFAFAFGRLLPETKVLLDYQRDIHYQSIVVTDQYISNISTMATIRLFASRGKTNEFHSMMAPTLLIENIILGLTMKDKESHIQRLQQLSYLRKKYHDQLPR